MKAPEFPVPKNYMPPEGTKEGESFTAPAEFKLKAGGKVCLVILDGVPYAEDEDKKQEAQGAAQAGQDFASRYQQAMNTAPQQQ